jgi:hypothetical protein
VTGSTSRASVLGRSRWLPLLLALVSAGATAGFAGAYLGAAWSGASHCQAATGAGCPAHPFWGFSPDLYLVASCLGVVVGLLVAGLGGGVFLGWLHPRRGGYAIVALSALGLIAYGGLGVGTVAGVAAGALLVRSRTGPPAPEEWSGSLPTGIPPMPPGSRRPMTNRPPVTEWKGIFATAPLGPPTRGRPSVTLPTADRLSAALERNRAGSVAPRESPDRTPAVVVLPPPPVGLRSVAPPPLGSVPERPPVSATATSLPRAVGPHEPSGLAPAVGRVASSALGPGPSPSRTPSLAPRAGASTSPEAPVARPPPPRAALGPLRAGWAAPSGGSVAPSGMTPPPPRALGPPATPTAPRPEPPAWTMPAVTPPARAPPESPTGRPPPPTGPMPKPRSKAWKCPKCGLINAPWTPRCTRCRTEPPSTG